MTAPPVLLRVQALHAGYGHTPVLFGVDLQVAPDDFAGRHLKVDTEQHRRVAITCVQGLHAQQDRRCRHAASSASPR